MTQKAFISGILVIFFNIKYSQAIVLRCNVYVSKTPETDFLKLKQKINISNKTLQ